MCIRNASELSTKNVSYICHTPENKLGFGLSLHICDSAKNDCRKDEIESFNIDTFSSIFPNVFPLVNDALWPAFCTTAASVLQWAEVWLTASVSSSLSTTVTLWHMARTVEFIAFSPLWWINVTKSRDDNNVSVATTPAPCQSPGFLPVFSKPTATPLILKSEMLYGSLGAHLTIPTLTTTHFTRYKKE